MGKTGPSRRAALPAPRSLSPRPPRCGWCSTRSPLRWPTAIAKRSRASHLRRAAAFQLGSGDPARPAHRHQPVGGRRDFAAAHPRYLHGDHRSTCRTRTADTPRHHRAPCRARHPLRVGITHDTEVGIALTRDPVSDIQTLIAVRGKPTVATSVSALPTTVSPIVPRHYGWHASLFVPAHRKTL